MGVFSPGERKTFEDIARGVQILALVAALDLTLKHPEDADLNHLVQTCLHYLRGDKGFEILPIK